MRVFEIVEVQEDLYVSMNVYFLIYLITSVL